MTDIDPTARIADGAVIGDRVSIGPYCVIGANAVIGDDCRLVSHVTVSGHTTLGAGCSVFPFAALGGAPQDFSYRGEPTRLEIGAGCTMREGVTMSLGTMKDRGVTRVGARGYFMNNSHVSHDCVVGDDVIFATSATLGGHCRIGDFVYIGGLSAVHQQSRVGAQAMIAGMSGVRGDVIPYGFVTGQNARLAGLNVTGMRRRKFTRARLVAVRAFYQKLFFGDGVFAERLDRVQAMAADDPAIADILAFIGADRRREFCLPEMRAAS